jgi:hypothetical protein
MERQASMERERSELDSLFQELKNLVRPDTSDFSGTSTNRATDSRRHIYDGTAPWALQQLAAGLHTHLTSPVDRWFSISVANVPYNRLSFDAKEWLETVSDIIYSHFANPHASFNSSINELYMDIGAFGTGVVYQWLDRETGMLAFHPYPLADCWIEENNRGSVCRVHRRIMWTVTQIEQEFGFVPPKLQKMKPSEKVTVIHSVYQRMERDYGNRHPKHRKYASVFICKDTEELLDESGFDWMPYHAPRWSKLSGDIYGRAPALSVFPEIRMVNAMSKTVIVAAQKMVDPALIVPDDGFLAPVSTAPGARNYARPGLDKIESMPIPQRIDIGIEMIEQRRDMIRRGFFVDWLVRGAKKERQTAQEIMDERNQMLSMMGSVTGRFQGELLGPIIKLAYNLLARQGEYFPPMPADLSGQTLDLVYTSPAAKAQSSVRGQGVLSYLGQVRDTLPMLPGMADSIDEDALNSELQDLNDVPRRILLDPEATAAKKKAREDQQQAMMAAEAAPKGAQAVKTVAEARQIEPGIV